MISDIVKNKRLIITILASSVVLFIFAFVISDGKAFFATDIAIIPLPIYCLYDKICVIRKLKKYDVEGHLLRKEGLVNLMIMEVLFSSDIYTITNGNLKYVTIGAIIYGILDLILIESIIKQQENN